jgi:hypothetical protein
MAKTRRTQIKESGTTSGAKVVPETEIGNLPLNTLFPMIALVFLISLLIRLPLLPIPLERDEGEYAYIAWRWGYNELPYRDWVDQKPPGIFVVYRLAMMLPIDPVQAVHFAGALFAAASAAALFLVAVRWISGFWATFAGILFGVMSAEPSIQGVAANTELFMLFPLILSVLAFMRVVRAVDLNVPLVLLCGMLTGLAAAFKQVAAINWLFLALAWPLVSVGRNKRRTSALFASYSLAGAAVPWAALALYFSWKGALPDFVYNVLTHNVEYAGGLIWADRWGYLQRAIRHLAPTHALVWLYSFVGLASGFRSSRPRWGIVWGLWSLTSLAGVSASGYYFEHYFLQLLPWLCLSAGLGGAALEKMQLSLHLPSAVRPILLASVPLTIPTLSLAPFLFQYSPQEAVTRIYPGNQFGQMPELGKRVAEITQPKDHLFVFGAESELLFYARRASATRYIFLFPLYGPYPNIREKQVAASEEIARNKPTAALFLPNDLFFNPGTEHYFTIWTINYLKDHFVPDSWLTTNKNGEVSVAPALVGADLAHPPTNSIGILLRRSQSAR